MLHDALLNLFIIVSKFVQKRNPTAVGDYLRTKLGHNLARFLELGIVFADSKAFEG